GIAVAMRVSTAGVVGWFKLAAVLIGMTRMGFGPRSSCIAKPRKDVGMRSDLIASTSFSIGASFADLGIMIASDNHTPINPAAEAKQYWWRLLMAPSPLAAASQDREISKPRSPFHRAFVAVTVFSSPLRSLRESP